MHIHAFSPPEVFFWSEKFGLSVHEVLRRLKEAGLQSLPGGGAEILHTGVRAQVSPNKCTAEQWLGVMEEAHKLGLRTTATMGLRQGAELTSLEQRWVATRTKDFCGPVDTISVGYGAPIINSLGERVMAPTYTRLSSSRTAAARST